MSPLGNDTGLNVEYWFRLIYNCFTGACYGTGNWETLLTSAWLWITWIGYIITLVGLCFIVYAMYKIYDLREREEEQFGELIEKPEHEGANSRWAHVEELMAGTDSASWRQAIIEADIMLDELLTKEGYHGAGVGEKLKQAKPADFGTLQDAWEAHKVRNEIAHSGSSFELSEILARRTMARYEAVFHEFEFI